MDFIPPYLAAEMATRELAEASDKHASRVIAAIRAVPGYAVSPELVAQIAAAFSTMCGELGPTAREIAQNYLDDLHDDMKRFENE
jgi:hypothetical protein